MLKLALVASAIALAHAQSPPEIASDGEGHLVTRSTNGVRQQRQQSVNSFDLSTAVEAQANEISALRGMVSTLMGADSPVTATVQAIATDMTQRTMNLMSAATANDQRLDGVTGSLDSLTSSVGGQLAAAAATNAAAQAEMAATLTATAQSMAAAMSAMTVRNTAQIASAVTASESRGSALQASLGSAIQAVNSTMIVSIAGKASEMKHVWLGGCRNHNHGCWQDMCMNGVELDTTRPYFYKRTDTRMRAIAAGFYRMNFWGILTRNWAHVSVMINGSRRTQTYMHTYHGWWKDQHQNHVHYITAGQDFWFQGCGNVHPWGSGNTHQRQEYMWYGTRPT